MILYARIILHFFYFFFSFSPVAKKRSDGQVLLSFALDEKLIKQMDEKRAALSRSAFIRVALVRSLGLEESVARPPEREGLSRGGKPTHRPKPKPVENKVMQMEIPLLRAAAGSPLLSDAEMVEVERDYGKGRFLLELRGDSMEPRFRDKQRIVMRDKATLKRPLLKYGELYAFVVNGRITFKQWAKGKVLRSLNAEYPDIPADEETDWIGWYDPKDNE